MPDSPENIHPVGDRMLQRSDKEAMLNQHGGVIWFTGLSGSGKTSVAIALEKKLHADGVLTQILDGDNIRTGLNSNLSFTDEDRFENIRRIAEVARLFAHAAWLHCVPLSLLVRNYGNWRGVLLGNQISLRFS
jgi:adenylylsulfate kinase